jgi:predicted O-linked N-acetylglucosamine transferase (SPINDLY family)
MATWPKPKALQPRTTKPKAGKPVARPSKALPTLSPVEAHAANRERFEAELKKGPPNARAWLALAQMALNHGDSPQARRAALTAFAQSTAPDECLAIGRFLSQVGEYKKAIEASLRGYEQLGRPVEKAAAVLTVALAVADWALVDRLIAQISAVYATGEIGRVIEGPRTHLLWCADEAINMKVIAQHIRRQYPPVANPKPFDLPPLAGRRLRVGYLSSDYREHATAWLINGLFRNHDLTRVEMFAYCCGWDDQSEVRRQVLSRFEHVCSVSHLSDLQAAEKIRADRIDILVDLNGPTRGNRLGILAQRAAPVQISYLGFPGTAGGGHVDYIVADDYVLPSGVEALYPEKVIRLTKTYQINDYAQRENAVQYTRSQVGLPEDKLVLGVFNAGNKIRSEVWDVWMRILKKVPNAVIWLLDPGDVARDNIAKYTHRAGVDHKRIMVAPRMKQNTHLSRLSCCDLMLDAWPYGGHTTTADALFSGVPVVTLEGSNFASRVSGGLLRAAGLDLLVQPDTDAYVNFAVKLLQTPGEIGKMKQFIKDHIRKQNVFNAPMKTRQLEDAYVVVAERAEQHLKPKNIRFETQPAPQGR